MGEADKAAADKARLFSYHKNNGTLPVFYDLYRDEESAKQARLRQLAQSLASGPRTTPEREQDRER